MSAAEQDGRDAANREGKYAGHVGAPECPHREGTREAAEWWKGFGDVTYVQIQGGGLV